jgi:hypothetical protein
MGKALGCSPIKLSPFAPPSVFAKATPGQVRRTNGRTEAGSALPLGELTCPITDHFSPTGSTRVATRLSNTEAANA